MERERRREEVMVEVLKRSVLTRRKEGNSTPSPTWKFGLIRPVNSNPISARKLGANLWEMNKNGPNFNHHNEEKMVEKPEQPRSGNNLRDGVAASTGPHNVRVESLSSASYCSSMEMAPHRTAITPNNSLGSKGRFGKSSPALKTSTELLKVLNRIWSLEEKHMLDMSLVKTLRRELDQSQAQFKELLQEKKSDQIEIDSLKEKLVEEKLKAEVKLRRNSEKLSRDLLEMKKSFANALRESERERKARILLEDLCDEFAKGIRDYEEKIRFMNPKCPKDQIGKECDDRLLLHVSEAWLDERMQMKLTDGHDVSEKQTVLNKLSFEIEAFLQAKQCGNFDKNDYTPSRKSNTLERSLESFHLNKPGSAPWNGNDEDDSISVGKKKSRSQNNPRRPKRGGMMQQSQDVDIYGTRRKNASLMEGSIDPCTFVGLPSPIKKWSSKVYVEDPESSRRGQRLETSTLKAKLMEARVKGQQSRARTTKGLSQVD